MRLAELLDGGVGSDLEITDLAHDTREVTPGALFFCVPGFSRDGHELAEEAVAAGAVALVVERELGLGVPEVVVSERTGGDGATGGALLRRSDGAACGRRHHRHERQDDDGVPACDRCSRPPAARPGCSGRSTSFVGGVERPTERTTPEAIALQRTFARDARRRRRRLRDGGVLACAGAAPRRRDPLGRGGLHEPDAGPPRLPPDDGGLLRCQGASVRRCRAGGDGPLVVNVDDPYGMRLAAGRATTASRSASASPQSCARPTSTAIVAAPASRVGRPALQDRACRARSTSSTR